MTVDEQMVMIRHGQTRYCRRRRLQQETSDDRSHPQNNKSAGDHES